MDSDVTPKDTGFFPWTGIRDGAQDITIQGCVHRENWRPYVIDPEKSVDYCSRCGVLRCPQTVRTRFQGKTLDEQCNDAIHHLEHHVYPSGRRERVERIGARGQ